MKSKRFYRATTWVKHFREIGSLLVRAYLAALPRRFERVRDYIDVVRVCLDIKCVQEHIDSVNPLVVLVDDKLFTSIEHPRKVRESRVKESHRKKLMMLADNLANYFRVLLKNNPRRFREELRRLEK